MGYLNLIMDMTDESIYLLWTGCVLSVQCVDTVCPSSKCLAQDTDWAELY